jgi:hypothetical protein
MKRKPKYGSSRDFNRDDRDFGRDFGRDSGRPEGRDSGRDFERDYDDMPPSEPSNKRGKSKVANAFNATSLFILAGVFILGIGIGLGLSSVSASGTPGNIVSVSELDSKVPNAELCVQYGSSAIVMDTRVFVTLSPINVFVSQPTTRPGCVLRTNNWSVLEQRGLLKGDQVRECKNRMNTFGYTGQLESNPQVDCVYQNDAAKNLFLNQPGAIGAPPPENQKF